MVIHEFNIIHEFNMARKFNKSHVFNRFHVLTDYIDKYHVFIDSIYSQI